MPTVRVFQNPDGSVRIMRLNEKHRLPAETDDQFFARETAKQPELGSLVFTDMDDVDLPASRAQRDKWRVAGRRVVVNPAVPDKPHPRQALLDEIGAANTLEEMRAALVKVVRGA
jgi:hypothetical protein